MSIAKKLRPVFVEQIFPWSLLALLLLYVYSQVFLAPYIGFDFTPSSGRIDHIFVNATGADLQIDDVIQEVNSVPISAYHENLRLQWFPAVDSGDILHLAVRRDGQERQVAWTTPGFNLREFEDRFINVWWLGFVFWLSGVATLLFVRPKDERWRLLIAFYFITAVWLVVGNESKWVILDSPIIMRMALWLAVPIYLHLHWVFPQPIRRLPGLMWAGLYLASLVFVVLQWYQMVPSGLAYVAFLVALLGSIVLLAVHYVVQPQQRRLIRNLAIAVAVGLLPSAFLASMAARYDIPKFGAMGLLFLLTIPAVYFYAAYRRHFADHNLRANRTLSIYLFLLLVSIPGTLIIATTLTATHFPGNEIVVAGAFALGSAILSLLVFPTFQRLVERYLLMMPHAPEGLTHLYAARITTSLNATDLAGLLRYEVLPSLLVRQSALLVRNEAGWRVLYAEGVDRDDLPMAPDVLSALLKRAGKYQSSEDGCAAQQPAEWVRLVLALSVHDEVVGCWLLGRRDPDDFYSPSEVDMLQLLANQTAIAIVNIEQAERLRALYAANIDRHEVERRELARIIHDEILRNLAILNNSLPAESITQTYEEAYARVDANLRGMTSRLRPVMLDVSLYRALEEMTDEIEDRLGVTRTVIFDLPASDVGYPEKVKEYLFRIVQNACENALQHAEASLIQVSGELEPGHAVIAVRDDGIGMADPVNLSDLAQRKHFGLVGMHERAELIGADLSVESAPGQGTEIKVEWIRRSERADKPPSTRPTSFSSQAGM